MTANPEILNLDLEILLAKLPSVRARVEFLAKRANRLRLSPITLTEGEAFKKTVEVKGKEVKIPYIKISVSGVMPKLNGWQFVGTLEPEPESGKMFLRESPVAGISIPKEYRNCGSGCDHCNIKRFRTATFIIHHEEKGFKKVGRSCIKDFLGHTNPSDLFAFYEFWELLFEEIDNTSKEGGESYDGGGNITLTEDFIALAVSVTQKKGFVSKTAASESYGTKESTASFISYLLTSPGINANPDIIRKWNEANAKFAPSDIDKNTASEAIKWAKGNEESDNNYLYNLSLLAAKSFVEPKNYGFLASLPAAYNKALSLIKEKEQKPVSEYVGEVKKRYDFTLTLKKSFPFEGTYGTSYIHLLEDDKGNAFKWSTANYFPENAVLIGKATIKAHTEYKGTKQTVLTNFRATIKN